MAGPFAVREPRAADPTPAEPEGAGFFGSIVPGFNRARAAEDWGLNQARYEDRLLAPLRNEARTRGFRSRPTASGLRSPYGSGLTIEEVEAAEIDQLLGWAAEERRRDPAFLSTVPELAQIRTRKDLREWALARRREDIARADAELAGGSTAGALVGALGAGFLDPTSYIPVGGQVSRSYGVARQILTVAGREAGANMALAAAQESAVKADAAALGHERTVQDFLLELGLQGVTGGVIGGGAKGLEIGAGRIAARRQAAGTAEDRAALAAFNDQVPPEVRTPDERAAARVVERTAEIAESSPFAPGAAGDAAHAAKLEAAFRRAQQAPPADVPRGSPPPPVTRSSLLAGTADPAKLRLPARETVKASIRQVESGGNDRAKNPASSASGRYQFTMDTWLGYYKRRYGKGKISNDQIWAKRFDPDLQEVLMNDLLADNARMLREAGQPETAGSLYLLHFAGPDGLKVLRAAPETPVAHLLPPAAINANKFLQGMKAADLVAWADRKMGSPGATVGRAAAPESPEAPLPELPEIDRGIVPVSFAARADWLDEADLPILRAEMFGTPEEHARAQLAVWRERDAEEGFAAVVDDPPPAAPAVKVRARDGAPRRSGRADLMREIAEAGGLIDDEGHDLVKGRGIPKFQLGAGAIIPKAGTPGARRLDEMGEYLWSRGWFGPPETAPRPRADEVLELVERGAREKVYRPDETADAVDDAGRAMAQSEEEALGELAGIGRAMGVEMDARTLDDALMRRAAGETAEDAVADAIDAARFRDLDPPAPLARFDDPDGDTMRAQMESLEHDLRMRMEEEPDAGWRFVDEDGEMTLAEALDEIGADEGAVGEMRGCLAPVREAAE